MRTDTCILHEETVKFLEDWIGKQSLDIGQSIVSDLFYSKFEGAVNDGGNSYITADQQFNEFSKAHESWDSEVAHWYETKIHLYLFLLEAHDAEVAEGEQEAADHQEEISRLHR